jgi:hypothetical protein
VRRLIYLKTVIIQEISYDELTISVLRLRLSKNSIKSQTDLLVYPLEEVLHRRLWD